MGWHRSWLTCTRMLLAQMAGATVGGKLELPRVVLVSGMMTRLLCAYLQAVEVVLDEMERW